METFEPEHEDPLDIEQHRGDLGGLPVFWREARAPGGGAPVLYLHGVPTHGEDWLPFLERAGGIAPDLPGFGHSGKPAEFDYSIAGYRAFLERFLDLLGVERLSLVVHDWGGVGLALAQTAPERVERLVVINCVPLLPGYRWHRLARAWRRPGLGEAVMGLTSRRTFRLISREARVAPGPMPDAFVDSVWGSFDHGTQRAILRLYRSAPSEALADAGRDLGEIRCPALVLWGQEDPYIPTSFAHDYAAHLGGPTQVEIVPGAGHWPWIDRPEVIGTVVGFLAGGEDDPSER